MATALFTSLLFLLLAPQLILCAQRCNPHDKKVLLQIKKDLNNPYHLASWDPKTDCCDWYVVTCDPNTHRINTLTIFSANISAQIPPSIGDLPYLVELEFHHVTNLTGPIQPAIAKLTNLKELRLSWTNLSGPVPDFLSQLKNLTLLELNFNQLTGTIPSSLSQLENLGSLSLDRNKLTGPIPDSFGSFKQQGLYLILSHNQLSGKIPASLGNQDFGKIDLSRNMLQGDASVLLGPNKTTQIIDISRNQFEFDLSKVAINSSMLIYLDLSHNKIYGSIPQQWVTLNSSLNLQYFNVSYNRLCGQIPVGGKLQDFTVYEYFHNRCLCGAPLPSCK